MQRDDDGANTRIELLGGGMVLPNESGKKSMSFKKVRQPCQSDKGAASHASNENEDTFKANTLAVCTRDMGNSIEGISSTINRLNEIAFNHALASENQSAAVVAEVRRSIQEAARGIETVAQTLGRLKSRMLKTGERHEEVMEAAIALDVQSTALQDAVALLTGKIRYL